MRTQKDKHFVFHKIGLRWFAVLTDGTKMCVLGSSTDFGDLIEDCRLNSTFDRSMEWVRKMRCDIFDLMR